MLKILSNKKAQAVASEYVLVFFIVATVVGTMTIYLRRAVQGRIHDARDTMVNMVVTRTAGYYKGNVYKGYEPYYTNKETDVSKITTDKTVLLPGPPGTTGVFRKSIDYKTRMKINSVTAPPKKAN